SLTLLSISTAAAAQSTVPRRA
ncbi:hypothetical protein E2320_016683, partial [Naja naja]